jgi:hypothetical protein
MFSVIDKLVDTVREKVYSVSLGVDDARKRTYLAFYILIVAMPVFLFGVWNIMQGQIANGVIVQAIFLVHMCVLVLILLVRRVYPVYRTYITLITVGLGCLLLMEGSGTAYLWMYLFPITLLYILGTREGLRWLAVTTAVLFGCLAAGGKSSQFELMSIVEFIFTYLVISYLSYAIEFSREFYYGRLAEEKKALEQSIKHVKTLQGLLPICASCKKIRDDKGYWNQIEVYVRDHSEADFSHSICPECFPKLYPELCDDNQTDISGRG